MNEEQKQIAWFGIVVLLAMALYPPWLYVSAGQAQTQQTQQGLHIEVSIGPKETATDYGWVFSPPSSSRLDVARLGLQVLAFGAFFALAIYCNRTVRRGGADRRTEAAE